MQSNFMLTLQANVAQIQIFFCSHVTQIWFSKGNVDTEIHYYPIRSGAQSYVVLNPKNTWSLATRLLWVVISESMCFPYIHGFSMTYVTAEKVAVGCPNYQQI